MISLTELSQQNPLFNNDLYISVNNLIELIFNHSNSDKDEVIVYLVQGLSEDSILLHQYTRTIGYHDINHIFFDFLTDDELEPYKFFELEEFFDLNNYYLPRDQLAKIEYITKLNIKSLSDFYHDDLPSSITLESDTLKEKLSDAEDRILKLEEEIHILRSQCNNLDCKNSGKNTRNQDPKIIAMLATLLSKKSPQFKYGNNPNRSAIKRGIEELIDELQIDHVHTYGLEAPEQRIKKCLEEFSESFFTTNKSKH